MTPSPPSVPPPPRGRLGLRLRLWIGALAGTIVAALGLAWVLAVQDALATPALAFLAIALLAVIVALIAALWLDRGIVGRARRLSASAERIDAAGIEDPPFSGWGELGDLRASLARLIASQRQGARALEQIALIESQIESARETVQSWIDSERWTELPAARGSLQSLTEALNLGFDRDAEVRDQNLEAARQVETDLSRALGEARETAEQSESAFVEVTSLLTSVRELERLGGELSRSLGPAERGATRDTLEPVTRAVSELIIESAWSGAEELIGALARVHELSSEVQVLGNRATLIALNAMLAARRGEAEPADSAEELKQLARDARVATDRVRQLAEQSDVVVGSAREHLRGLRDRAAEQLARLGTSAPTSAPTSADAGRALERVREMVADAARKAERLSTAGERASRAADRLVRRLEEDLGDVAGLVVRLAPPGAPGSSARRAEPRRFDVIGSERAADDTGGRRSISEERP